MPTGTIARLLIDKGFGFIRDEGGVEHFFHRSAVRGAVFELLREGQRVEFTPRNRPRGRARATFASSRTELPSVVPGPRHTGAGTLGRSHLHFHTRIITEANGARWPSRSSKSAALR